MGKPQLTSASHPNTWTDSTSLSFRIAWNQQLGHTALVAPEVSRKFKQLLLLSNYIVTFFVQRTVEWFLTLQNDTIVFIKCKLFVFLLPFFHLIYLMVMNLFAFSLPVFHQVYGKTFGTICDCDSIKNGQMDFFPCLFSNYGLINVCAIFIYYILHLYYNSPGHHIPAGPKSSRLNASQLVWVIWLILNLLGNLQH